MKKNRNKILTTLSLLGLLASCGAKEGYVIEPQSVQGGSAFYEIFVGSYCDSNGDGIGDLKGIENKLDYIQKLGVSNIWLTPVHPSNSYHKYDVKDYYAIDPTFGTLDDFDSLVKKAKEKGIGVIMDMVFNHTSRKSTWFTNFAEAARRGDLTSQYIDNFVWSTKPKYGYTEMSECGGLYIETNFDSGMPELNLDSEYVREELKKIQNFWLGKGVAGFRYDAVVYYYCENNGGVISGDLERNVAFMKYLHDAAKETKSDVYLVGEAWINDQNTIASYTRSGMNAFNFVTSGVDASGSAGKIALDGGPQDFAAGVVRAQQSIKEAGGGAEPCYFVSNHDQDRWGTFRNGLPYAEEARKAVASCYLLTPGTPFIYYGEEIQMRGIRKSTEMTDAARRQAMVWGDPNITCVDPEKYKSDDQVTIGVAQADEDGYSMLNHYRKVLSIRNKHKGLFRNGTYSALNLGDERACGFKINYDGKDYYLYHNCYRDPITVKEIGSGELLESVNTVKTAPKVSGSTIEIPAYSTILVR